MVQLRKSRKSFRKTRGRKTRQRKNEKRKSRKTRSTRKTGGLREEKIADKIKELASKIGELVKLQHDKEQKEEDAFEKKKEIQKIFNWLINWKLVSCGKDATCQRKKMIYYYIAIHLFMCFRKFIITTTNDEEEGGQKEELIAKFENHRTREGVREAERQTWWDETRFIGDIVEILYDSILEQEERADYGRMSEAHFNFYGHVILYKILGEVEVDNINDFVSKENSIFVKWIEQIKNLKIIANEELKKGEYEPSREEIINKRDTWAKDNGYRIVFS